MYGSGPTGICLEIGLRENVAPATPIIEVKNMLNDSRFVDDLADSYDDADKLIFNLRNYISVCSQFGFTHGDVSMTNNLFEGCEQNQLRTLLGITWDPSLDKWSPNTEWNISAKVRGIYKEQSLKQMTDADLEAIQITRTLRSRLLGQTHEPLEKVYSSVIMYLKILGRKANRLTSKWNEVIEDAE